MWGVNRYKTYCNVGIIAVTKHRALQNLERETFLREGRYKNPPPYLRESVTNPQVDYVQRSPFHV